MKKSIKFSLLAIGLIFGASTLGSCTASFCSNEEKCRILFAIEPGVSMYYETEADALKAQKGEGYVYTTPSKVWEDNENVWRMVEKKSNGNYTKSNQLMSIINSANTSGYYVPSDEYFIALDQKVLEYSLDQGKINYSKATLTDILGYNEKVEGTDKEIHRQGLLEKYGYIKFYGENNNLWDYYDRFYNYLKIELGSEKCPSSDFLKLYKNNMNTVYNNYRSCISTMSGENMPKTFGAYGQDYVAIEVQPKTWGDAWHTGGAVIEGLIVYPVAWLVDQFAYIFAGGAGCSADQISLAYAGGVPQLLSLLIVTIIVRLFIFLVTFKSTLSQQKMQRLQPEIAKIQAKYPNANTNQAQKQRMADEQMKFYKKNKVNPLSSLLTLIVQFPIFIGVWGAMTGSAVLSTGAFMNLNLSTSIWNCLTNTAELPTNNTGWWTAFVLIIAMSVAQFLAMKVPQWITKSKTKKVAKLGKNPAQSSQNKTMNIISYVMLVMIIVMGFTLPAGMGVYWLVGAIFSLAQTLIMQFVTREKKHK